MQNRNNMSFPRRASGRCEEWSDEESLLLLKISSFVTKPRPFATAQGDINLICIQTLSKSGGVVAIRMTEVVTTFLECNLFLLVLRRPIRYNLDTFSLI